MIKRWKSLNSKQKSSNLILYFVGVAIIPVGVVLTINAHLGAGGYDALNFVLAEILKIKTSYAIYGSSIVYILIGACLRRAHPRLETFIASFFMGIFTDIWKRAFASVQGNNFLSSIVLMLLGTVIIAFCAACYMKSVFPPNPPDDLVKALGERGMRLGMAKILFDVICVVLAFLLGGEIGVGTIIITLFLGPLIGLFYGRIERIVDGKKEES